MTSINKNAWRIVESMIANETDLGINTKTLECGTKIVDCHKGGLQTGRLYAEACMGGLGRVTLVSGQVHVQTDLPLIACMASQYAGWKIKVKYLQDGRELSFSALGSGPARSLARVEKIFEEIDYEDDFDKGVLMLETGTLPADAVADFVAEKCRISPDNLYLLVAPTASIVGSVQISARILETGLHKLRLLGFDLRNIKKGFGAAPIAPVGKNEMDAMGKTNDCILYGGETVFDAYCDDEEIEGIIDQVPSSASPDYGKPFIKMLESSNFQFSKINPAVFSPASIVLKNLKTGRTWKAGKINREILEKSLCSC